MVKKRSGPHEDTDPADLVRRRQAFTSSEPLMHLRGVLTGVPVEVGAAEPPLPTPGRWP